MLKGYPLSLIALVTLPLLACSEESDHGDATDDDRRRVEHVFGTAEVPARPERIAVTSLSLTGHLLALDAPVAASATTAPGSELADDNGFFRQWADVAVERAVTPLPGPQLNIEALAETRPDLIIGAAFGRDGTTEDVYDLLTEIAPTVVLDISGISWQAALELVADATGRQEAAAEVIAGITGRAEAVDLAIDAEHPVAAFTIAPDGGLNVFTPESAHGRLLDDLGLAVVEIDGAEPELMGGGARSDVVALSAENLAAELGSSSLLVVFADDERVADAVSESAVLAALPAVDDGRLVALGFESFRIDPFSVSMVLDRLAS